MHILVDALDEADTETALATLLERVRARDAAPPSFLAVHASARHDPAAVQRAARTAGVETLHGGTSCLGVMAGGRLFAEAGFGIFALWDEAGGYGSAAASGPDGRAVGREAARGALAAAGRPGEAPDLVWLTAAPGTEEAVLAGIEDVVGASTPILGGSAADDTIAGGWAAYDARAVEPGGVVVSALFPSRPVSWAYSSGYVPAGASGVVTRAAGRRLIEIDGRPAAAVYGDWTGNAVAPAGDAPRTILSESTFRPLGRSMGSVGEVDVHLLAHPATIYPDGAIELFADVAEGERLLAMTGSADSLVTRAGRVAALAARRGGLATDEIAGALVVFCAGCMLAVREDMDRVAAEVQTALGDAPALGLFTFGEQGPVVDVGNRHGNLMISCITFGR